MRRGLGLRLAPFALGAFSMTAQAVLFRVHLIAFGGHEIGFGVFLASWLAWIGVGAALARTFPKGAARVGDSLSGWLLAYLPLFLIQALALSQLRGILGVQQWLIPPIDGLTWATCLANAPVSLWTGFLFVAAVGADPGPKTALGRVYAGEALGGVVGGLTTTILLTMGVDPLSVVGVASAVLALPAALGAGKPWRVGSLVGRIVAVTRVLPLLACLLALGLGVGPRLSALEAAARWARALPDAQLEQQLFTPEGELLTGARRGASLIVKDGRIASAWPDREQSATLAALLISQHEGASRVFLSGDVAPAVAVELLALEGIRRVRVHHADAAYLEACWAAAGIHPRSDERLEQRSGDAGVALGAAKEPAARGALWDVVAILGGDPLRFVDNRTYTLEFLQLAKRRMTHEGVVALRFSGGEDYMDLPQVGLGGSLLSTARHVFAYDALKPGNDSLLFASNGSLLSERAALLVERLRRRDPGGALLAPEELFGAYLPGRIEAARADYTATTWADVTSQINRDLEPVSHLMSLLMLAQEGERGVDGLARAALLGSWPLAMLPFLVVALLLFLWAPRAPPASRARVVAAVMAALAGFVGMAVNLLVLDLYQLRFGTLYLDLGLLSAVFMAGLAGGAVLALRIPSAWQIAARPGVLLLLGLTMLAIPALYEHVSPTGMACLLFAPALFAGAIFVVAGTARDPRGGGSPGGDASWIQSWDYVGAALAGFVVALWWVPVLGLARAWGMLLAIAIGGALFVGLAPLLTPRAPGLSRVSSPMAWGWWALAALCLSLGLGGAVLRSADQQRRPVLPPGIAAALAHPEPTACHKQSPLGHPRCEVYDPEGRTVATIDASASYAPDSWGFGGRIRVIVRSSVGGIVQGLELAEDDETAGYRARVVASLDRYLGTDASSSQRVEAVTGATVTSRAVSKALSATLAAIHGAPVAPEGAGEASASGSLRAVAWTVLLSLFAAILLAIRPSRWARRLVLLGSVGLLGVLWNAQFSLTQVLALLSLQPPSWQVGYPFWLLFGVLGLTLLLGNLYCGHACPFGALQDLLADLSPWRVRLDEEDDRWSRRLRFGAAVLLGLFLVFGLGGAPEVLGLDPLAQVFSFRSLGPIVAMVIASALVAGVFVPRFFCRGLCPTGVVLDLLGSWRLLKNFGRPKRVSDCELEVRGVERRGCLRCDRCLTHAPVGPPPAAPRRLAAPLLRWLYVVLLVTMLSAVAWEGSYGASGGSGASMLRSGRGARVINEAELRSRIEQGRLSDKEALFYTPMAPAKP